MEKDINRRMMEVQESIAPKHIAKTTIEDDIGMVHELTQVSIFILLSYDTHNEIEPTIKVSIIETILIINYEKNIYKYM